MDVDQGHWQQPALRPLLWALGTAVMLWPGFGAAGRSQEAKLPYWTHARTLIARTHGRTDPEGLRPQRGASPKNFTVDKLMGGGLGALNPGARRRGGV